MNVVAIVQARATGSTRMGYPKVLEDIGGHMLFEWVLSRVRLAHSVDVVCLAIPDSPLNDELEEMAEASGLCDRVVRGAEHDVMARYIKAADELDADVVVRITADCPLIEPMEINRSVRKLTAEKLWYVSNITHPRTVPHGLDLECFTADALRNAHREATAYEREGCVVLVPDIKGDTLQARDDLVCMADKVRLTVDYPEDLTFMRELADRVGRNVYATMREVKEALDAEPSLVRINWFREEQC